MGLSRRLTGWAWCACLVAQAAHAGGRLWRACVSGGIRRRRGRSALHLQAPVLTQHEVDGRIDDYKAPDHDL
ncbi:hypothetical protein LY76DRAFT_143198 [Colletotrichum caudatum]|nr:hypothetical protein LY76DRAFT_143198 [Colletotrichum caudatum]